MKINEFIEKVNKVAYAKKDGDCIYICDGETTSYQDYDIYGNNYSDNYLIKKGDNYK